MASTTDVTTAEYQRRLRQQNGGSVSSVTRPAAMDDAVDSVQQARIAAAVRTRVRRPRFYSSLNFKVLVLVAIATGAYYYYFLQ